MQITEIKLSAYRVFAGQEHAHLSSGVNAIVGPDGGGKSALCESVLWAVGHEDIRPASDEVIFEGSKDRPEASAAVVELMIAGKLPGFDEVQVRRVAFRGAEHGVHQVNQESVADSALYKRLQAGVIRITTPEQCLAMAEENVSDKIFIVDDVDRSLGDGGLAAFARALDVLGRRNQLIVASHSKTVMKTATSLIGMMPKEFKVSGLVTLAGQE